MKNIWGEKVYETEEHTDDPWFVPPKERRTKDQPGASDDNALEGGDDLDGWTPEDGPPE